MKIRRESTTRVRVIGRNIWRFEKSWHYLNNGDQYHYAHAYIGNNPGAVKRFYWVVKPNGEILWL